MLIEIYSDVVCPWCYIGKRRFEEALARFPRRDQIDVVWRPYQLDPTAPKAPSPVADAYAKKFGGPEKAAQIISHVTATAAEVGLEFRMDIAQRANTFDAHRVIGAAFHAGGAALQGAVKERLLRAYFVEGVDVANRSELIRLGAEAGMTVGAVEAALDSAESAAETRSELVAGNERGVTAVPTFVVNGEWGIPGAQDPEVFLRMLNKLVPE
jgi:predicted DsbA family dithiol-disulfide isomerase